MKHNKKREHGISTNKDDEINNKNNDRNNHNNDNDKKNDKITDKKKIKVENKITQEYYENKLYLSEMNIFNSYVNDNINNK